MKKILLAALMGLTLAQARAAVVGKEVEYKAGETTLKGYLAVDDANNDQRPAVLVVHEWWGHNEYARKRARMLAELGYVALAVDMYGDGKTVSHPDDAGKMAGEVRKNMPVGEARFRAAEEFVKQQPQTDARKLGAIGYCFGGSVVQHMARIGEDLSGVVSFHGSLASTTKAEAGKVSARILICNGAEDPMITEENIKAFEDEMSGAGAKFRVINYKGAKHSFTNPDADKFGEQFKLPLAYNKDADEQSWEDMRKFLREAFSAK